MRFKLSSRLHIPVLRPTFSTDSYSLFKFNKIRKAEKIPLQLDTRGLRFFINKPKNFHDLYFPSFDLKGKTVLLVGAGCGEACYEYLKVGALNVICVENNWDRIIYLLRNYGGDSRVDIEMKPFALSILDYPHDFALFNIGGYEIELIYAMNLKPTHVLAHSQYHVDLLKHNGFSEINNCGGQPYNGYAWMTNEIETKPEVKDEFRRTETNEMEVRAEELKKIGI